MPASQHDRRKGGDVRFRYELIEQARRDKGWNQGELAKAAGMKQPSISLLESGEWPPSLYNAARLARALGRPLDDFLDFAEFDGTQGPPDVAIIPREQFEHLQALKKYARQLLVAIAKEGDLPTAGLAARGRALKKIVATAEALDADG